MTQLTGRCLCGAVRYAGLGQPTALRVCHCADCRRWNGGPATTIEFERGFDIRTPEAVRWFRSSDWAERGSCTACGSTMFYRLLDGDYINVSAGGIDDQAALPAISEHVFADSKPDWYDFADGAPRVTGEEMVARFQPPLGNAT